MFIMDPKNQKSAKKITSEKVKKTRKKRKNRKQSGKSDVKDGDSSPSGDQNFQVEGVNILEDIQNGNYQG